MKLFTAVLLCLCSLYAVTAQMTITGKVNDAISPLPFATLSIKGTDKGVLTNANGDFKIEASKGDILEISYVGYAPQKLVVDTAKHLTITLDNEQLDEVIVYGQALGRTCTRSTKCSWSLVCEQTGVAIKNERAFTQSKENPIKVYPNPSSSGRFTMQLLNGYDKVTVFVTAMSGQQVFAQTYGKLQQQLDVDISRYPAGMYIVNVMADGVRLPSQKVIRA